MTSGIIHAVDPAFIDIVNALSLIQKTEEPDGELLPEHEASLCVSLWSSVLEGLVPQT